MAPGVRRQGPQGHALISYCGEVSSGIARRLARCAAVTRRIDRVLRDSAEARHTDLSVEVQRNRDVPVQLLDDDRNFRTAADAFEYIFPEYGPVGPEAAAEITPYEPYRPRYAELPADLAGQVVEGPVATGREGGADLTSSPS